LPKKKGSQKQRSSAGKGIKDGSDIRPGDERRGEEGLHGMGGGKKGIKNETT